MQDERKRLLELLKGYDTAMLVTLQDETGNSLRSRPMQVAQLDETTGEIWLVTGEDSGKVREIHQDEHVLLAFQDERSSYVSISGTARLVRDRAKIDQVWQKGFDVWFPKGKDDPNVALLQITPEMAEYWDNTGTNKIDLGFKSAKALFTGEPPKTDKQYGRVNL